MVQVVKASSKKREERKKLKDLEPGSIFRFADTSLEEALANSGTHFFMVVKTVPEKTGKVSIVSADGMFFVERDDSHIVIAHPAKLKISKAKHV